MGGGGVCLCSVDRDLSSWVVLYKKPDDRHWPQNNDPIGEDSQSYS